MRLRDDSKELAIREKAMEMIVREGFDGLSMQKLACSVGISPSTIYVYFKNREDLLNRLFIDVQHKFSVVALEGFDPAMSFEEGLWLQWKNRLRFIRTYPIHFKFYEQFRTSPLVNHDDIQLREFKASMGQFMANAIQRGEIQNMEPELFWSVAYGCFYALIRFDLQEKMLLSVDFTLTEERMRYVFEMVIKSFTHEIRINTTKTQLQ